MSSSHPPRVVALGGIGLDIICHDFPLVELAPEREVVGGGYEIQPGGSTVNFACTAAGLGLPAALVGKTGEDAHGQLLRTLVEDAGVAFFPVASADVQTRLSVNYNGPNGEMVMTTIGNASDQMTADDVLPVVESLIADADYLYLGGCLKLSALLPALPELARNAKKLGTTVVVDHGRVFGRLSDNNRQLVRELCREADFYFPSIDELTRLWNADSMNDAARSVMSEFDGTLVVKDGRNGVVAFTDGQSQRVDAYSVAVHNPVGAGDSFNAGFIRAHSDSMALADALDFGCATAALRISQSNRPAFDDVQAFRSANGRPC